MGRDHMHFLLRDGIGPIMVHHPVQSAPTGS